MESRRSNYVNKIGQFYYVNTFLLELILQLAINGT